MNTTKWSNKHLEKLIVIKSFFSKNSKGIVIYRDFLMSQSVPK